MTRSIWTDDLGRKGERVAENRRALLVIFLVIFVDLLGFGLVMPLMPLFADRLGCGDVTIGLLQSSFSIMQFLFAPLWGRLSDRVGRRPILIFGLVGSVFFYALFGYASEIGAIGLMFVARIGAGVAGATIATAQAFIADSTSKEKRTAGMAIIGAAFGMGFVFGPLIGALALWIGDVGAGVTGMPGYLAAGFSTIALILALTILPESLRADSKAVHRGWFSIREFRQAVSLPAIGSLIGIFFIATFAFAGFESTVARFAFEIFHLDLRSNFLLFAYFGFLLVLAQGGVRSLSKRMADEQIGLTGAGLLLAGMLIIVIAAEMGSQAVLYVAPVVLVAGFAFLTTSTQSLISQRSRADDQGGILGLNQSASSMARIAGPIVGNVAFGLRPTLPYLLAAGLMMLVVVALARLPAAASVGDSSPSPS